MKTCLVRLPIVIPRNNMTTMFTPPLGVAHLAGALLAAGHELQVVDGLDETPDETIDGYANGLLPLATVGTAIFSEEGNNAREASAHPMCDLVQVASRDRYDGCMERHLISRPGAHRRTAAARSCRGIAASGLRSAPTALSGEAAEVDRARASRAMSAWVRTDTR